MSPSPLKQQGNPPRGPSFVCPGGGSVGPLSPRPAAPDAPGQLGVSRAPRAQHLAGAAHGVGSASRLQAGSLHFQGRGSNNKPSGAAARAPLPRGVPRLPSNPPAGGHQGGRPPRPGPAPSPGATRDDRRAPHAHRLARRPLAPTATPASQSAPLGRPAAGRRSLVARPARGSLGSGVGAGQGPRSLPGGHAASPERPVFVCKVSAGGEPTSARAQRRVAPSPALAPGGGGGAQRPGVSGRPGGGAGGGSDRGCSLWDAGRLFHTPRPRASELSGGAGRGAERSCRGPAPAPPRRAGLGLPAAASRVDCAQRCGCSKSGDLVPGGFPSIALVWLASETLGKGEEMWEEKNEVSPDEK